MCYLGDRVLLHDGLDVDVGLGNPLDEDVARAVHLDLATLKLIVYQKIESNRKKASTLPSSEYEDYSYYTCSYRPGPLLCIVFFFKNKSLAGNNRIIYRK